MNAEIREVPQLAAARSPFAVYVDGAYHCSAASREHAASPVQDNDVRHCA